MADRSDSVRIWSSQLAAKDLPPICAMTGRPADTWRKFRFMTPSVWTILLLLPLVVLDLGGPRPKARQVSGHLPLAKSAVQRAVLEESVVAFLPLGIIVGVTGIVIGRTNPDAPDLSAIARTLITLGLVLLVMFVVGAVLRELVGLGAKVLAPPAGSEDQIVELRRVHPTFVAAVNQMHHARTSQSAATQHSTGPPTPPVSN
jgi:hypothetical protein